MCSGYFFSSKGNILVSMAMNNVRYIEEIRKTPEVRSLNVSEVLQQL
jgi:hypothetical protein